MKNWLEQEIGVGDTVYLGERQGSHGRLVGRVVEDVGDNRYIVHWLYELWRVAVPVNWFRDYGMSILTKLDDGTIQRISERNEELARTAD
jgi:hypothetical protein